jgi:hypothetical protein
MLSLPRSGVDLSPQPHQEVLTATAVDAEGYGDGQSAEAALDAALAGLDRVLAASEGREVLQLSKLNAGP